MFAFNLAMSSPLTHCRSRSNLVGQIIAFMASPLLGEFADRYGYGKLLNFVASCGIVGVALIMIAVATGLDWLLFPAFIVNGMMAISTGGIMTVKTGLVFEGRARIR